MTKRLKLPFQTVLISKVGRGHGGEMFAPPYPLAPTQVTLSGGQGHGGDISSPLNLAGGQRHGGENFVYAPILALSGGHGHGGEIGQPVSAIGAHGHGGQITFACAYENLRGWTWAWWRRACNACVYPHERGAWAWRRTQTPPQLCRWTWARRANPSAIEPTEPCRWTGAWRRYRGTSGSFCHVGWTWAWRRTGIATQHRQQRPNALYVC
jgi:hypothetical protein